MPKGKKGYSAKQMKIARVAPPRNKITGADFKALKKEKEKEMKVKGVDVSSLRKDNNKMKKHSQHHTKNIYKYMLNSMKRGATLTQAHKEYEESR